MKERKRPGFLTSTHAWGFTEADALYKMARRIGGQVLVFNATGASRREIDIPEFTCDHCFKG